MPVSAPAQWHKRMAAITGELSFSVIKRKMTKGDVLRWSAELRSVADEMKALTDAPSARS